MSKVVAPGCTSRTSSRHPKSISGSDLVRFTSCEKSGPVKSIQKKAIYVWHKPTSR